jgi:epoxyqueuosine reductase
VSSTLDKIRRSGTPHGLNLVAATPVARYDAKVKESSRASSIDPQTRSIVVIGNGGGALWHAFKAHTALDPGWWSRENPLDDFTREVVERDIAAPIRASGARCTTVYPFLNNGPTLNFIELGKVAGVAGPSILGVTVHPIYGPWIAFRAALLLDEELDSPGDALDFDPCPRCAVRSCIPACPANAVSVDAGWDIPKCLTHRVEVEADCALRCHARANCVLGPEHRYPDEELAYHQMRSLRAIRPYYVAHLKSKS